ncbi:PCC domain-containing protein [Microvirga lotononidis]|uniref:Putative DNA-binding protein with PD1-like DNA-binding motif n=1 Tax=Microvirga lotononidis TaxID=864069 RepID=I4Z121_9HYPH|nr:PPC domain-containing DNA-binding protein [Microvirga lotononidis]EIM29913.1 putative DNA-binding protein with PD1-like DNA-binding motif [Microvirga lotononidis]WQO31010.1 PPC domain-containing DNA-binding protein [Microvirga lotononidis]
MRHILHPGAVAPERMTAVAAAPVPLRFTLEPGEAVDAAIAKGFAASGCIGGIVAFQGGRFETFRFVMPAASPDALHAAWYSDTFAPAGPVEIRRGCAIVGERDGKPFIHCHGVWASSEGVQMGHMLAPDTVVAEPIEVTGIGVRTATFRALPDPETNFTLFEPVQVGEPVQVDGSHRVLLTKVRPNEDISLALEQICSRHGITKARVHGIGSLNGVRFADGSRVESHATEVLIREGEVELSHDRLRGPLHVDVVDPDGRIFSGDLVHGDNPVCVTFELMIEGVA